MIYICISAVRSVVYHKSPIFTLMALPNAYIYTDDLCGDNIKANFIELELTEAITACVGQIEQS